MKGEPTLRPPGPAFGRPEDKLCVFAVRFRAKDPMPSGGRGEEEDPPQRSQRRSRSRPPPRLRVSVCQSFGTTDAAGSRGAAEARRNGDVKSARVTAPCGVGRTGEGECALRAPGKLGLLRDLCGGSFQRLDRIGAIDPMSSGKRVAEGLSFMGGYPLAKLTEQPYAYCVERLAVALVCRRGMAALPPASGFPGTDTRCQRAADRGTRRRAGTLPPLFCLPSRLLERYEHYKNFLAEVKPRPPGYGSPGQARR